MLAHVKLTHAANQAIRALDDLPLSPEEMHAALLMAAFTVKQATDADTAANVRAIVMDQIRKGAR